MIKLMPSPYAGGAWDCFSGLGVRVGCLVLQDFD